VKSNSSRYENVAKGRRPRKGGTGGVEAKILMGGPGKIHVPLGNIYKKKNQIRSGDKDILGTLVRLGDKKRQDLTREEEPAEVHNTYAGTKEHSG